MPTKNLIPRPRPKHGDWKSMVPWLKEDEAVMAFKVGGKTFAHLAHLEKGKPAYSRYPLALLGRSGAYSWMKELGVSRRQSINHKRQGGNHATV